MRNKYIKFIVIIYLTILSVGAIFYYFIPKDKFIQIESPKNIIESEEWNKTILENPASLTSMKRDGKQNIESYVFNYEGRELEIVSSNLKGEISIDRKSTNDNKIEVYRYKTPTTFEGVDISDKIKAEKIELIGNKIDFVYEKQEYSYTAFPKDFTITQFYKEKDDKSYYKAEEKHIMYSARGNSILYIKIPKDLVILNHNQIKNIK